MTESKERAHVWAEVDNDEAAKAAYAVADAMIAASKTGGSEHG